MNCPVCGERGTKRCGQCNSVSYCSQEHQREHWKAGHKKQCHAASNTSPKPTVQEDHSNTPLAEAMKAIRGDRRPPPMAEMLTGDPATDNLFLQFEAGVRGAARLEAEKQSNPNSKPVLYTTPNLTRKEMGINRPRNDLVDIKALPEWNMKRDGKLNDVFDQTFSMREKFMSEQDNSNMPKDVNFQMRESMLHIAVQLDGDMTSRWIVMDHTEPEQSQNAVCIDVLSVHKAKENKQEEEEEEEQDQKAAAPKQNRKESALRAKKAHPLLFVRFREALNLKGACVSFKRVPLPFSRHANPIAVRTTQSEVMGMVSLLRYNTQMLKMSPGYRKKDLPKGFAFSFMEPLSVGLPLADNKRCICGRRGDRACSRCHVVRYCSPECQKAAWKQHKKECFDRNAQDYIDVPAPDPSDPHSQLFCSVHSNQKSVRDMQVKSRSIMEAFRSTEYGDQEAFTIKIQIPLGTTAAMAYQTSRNTWTSGMVVYDKRRSMQASLSMKNTTFEQFAKIHKLITAEGTGKGYFSAEYRNDQSVLRIFYSRPFPQQPW